MGLRLKFKQPKGTAQISEAKKILDSANTLFRGFDGFEKWLYSDTEYLNTLSYPKTTYLVGASYKYTLKAKKNED